MSCAVIVPAALAPVHAGAKVKCVALAIAVILRVVPERTNVSPTSKFAVNCVPTPIRVVVSTVLFALAVPTIVNVSLLPHSAMVFSFY